MLFVGLVKIKQNMNYSNEFKNIVKKCQEKSFYLGTGNPNASILVIGKECAIEPDSEQCQREISNNINDWNNNITQNIQFENVSQYVNNPQPKYNPLFPYKGQRFAVRKERKDKKIINDGGTSDTWANYQKLNNKIFEKKSNVNDIDFHKSFFISEMNEVVSKTSEISKKEAKESIEKSIRERLDFFKNDYDFFQKFSIIILACGKNYIREQEIESIFRVNSFKEEILKQGQYFRVFFNDDKTKLVINTRQFSSGVLGILMAEIANEIKLFAKENNIQL